MATNVADVYNQVLKWIKYLPLTGIVDVTFKRMEAYLKNTSVVSDPSMKYPVHVQGAEPLWARSLCAVRNHRWRGAADGAEPLL